MRVDCQDGFTPTQSQESKIGFFTVLALIGWVFSAAYMLIGNTLNTPIKMLSDLARERHRATRLVVAEEGQPASDSEWLNVPVEGVVCLKELFALGALSFGKKVFLKFGSGLARLVWRLSGLARALFCAGRRPRLARVVEALRGGASPVTYGRMGAFGCRVRPRTRGRPRLSHALPVGSTGPLMASMVRN